MRLFALGVVLCAMLSGCSTGSSPAPAATPTGTARPGATSQPSPKTRVKPAPSATPAIVNSGFAQTVHSLCTALAQNDASTAVRLLPYYQYNSGLRYGMLGDGEGETGDPSLMTSWLAGSHVRCRYQTTGAFGHGTVLATGWKRPGETALIELDTYSGRWKINDFTFGPRGALFVAMQTARPVLPYVG